MALAVGGEPIVGPDVLAPRCFPFGNSGRDAGGGIPILRRIGDSPNIALVVQRHSNQEEFCVLAQRQAIGDATGCASTARQLAEQHRSFDGQCLRGANAAPLRAYYQCNALRCERVPAIHAGDDQRNLHPQSRTAPCRLGCEYLHL